MKEKLQKLIADYEARELWGSIELTFRGGEIAVINKSETIKEELPSHVRHNNSR